MYRTHDEVAWLESLRFDCPKCHAQFGAIVHKDGKARPLMYCPNGCRSALLRFTQRLVVSAYVLVGGARGAWVWHG